MTNVRAHLLIGFMFFGQTGTAAAEDCYYGAGRYTAGTILCQSATRMQCALDSDGQATWRSLDEQCTDFMDTPILPVEPQGAIEPSPEAAADTGATGRDTASATSGPSAPAPGAGTGEAARAADTGQLTIEILWADYGRDGQNCDAAAAVTERCNGAPACRVDVNPATLCAEDPIPGRKKLLSVYWKCRSSVEEQAMLPLYAQDGSQVELTCN